jgi:hypothetical protein
MEQLYKYTVPEGLIDRVHAFARFLALGVALEQWGAMIHYRKRELVDDGVHLRVARRTSRNEKGHFVDVWESRRAMTSGHEAETTDELLSYQLSGPWQRKTPKKELLLAFDYVIPVIESNPSDLQLTAKAFSLLEQPIADLEIFISYRRGQSTALALYLESRLRLAGNHAVFVDKALEPGSKWRDVLTEKINRSKFMIVLCTHGTFDGDPKTSWVFREIRLGQSANVTIIPIMHPAGRDKFTTENIPNVPELDVLRDSQMIKVQDATAAEYETAVNKLLSFMGYSTY